MPPDYEIVAAKIDQIEAEMRRIRAWQEKPLEPGKLNFHRPFGGDTMAFEQWLQFVFIPRVRQIIAARGEFPDESQVHDQAFREWKMWGSQDNVDQLLELLQEFDGFFGKS